MARFSAVVGAVLPNVIEVGKRFPFAVLFSLILTIWLLRSVMYRIDVDIITFGLLSLFFAAVGVHLMAERRGWSLPVLLIAALLVFFILALMFYFDDVSALTPVMMTVTIAIAGSTMLYLFEGAKRKAARVEAAKKSGATETADGRWLNEDNRKYWHFNHQYWFSFGIAILGGLLVAGLLALLIGAYSTLFDKTVYSRVYSYTFIVSLFLIAPLFWLSMLPDDFNEMVNEGEPVEFTSKVTGLFVKYLFVPFFFLFALLFHGLAIKIAFDGAFPKGQLGWYGLALVIGCIGTYLMAFPTRNSAGPLVRMFTTNWIWFLLVPLGLIMTAHFIRIQEYGMTPLRFYLAGLFLWALVLIGYTIFVRQRGGVFDLRVILYLAMLVLGLSSFGPFGAEAVSTSWQKSRLITLLAQQGVLDKGVIVRALPDDEDIKASDARQVRQILNFFRKGRRGEMLSFLLPQEKRQVIEAELAGARQKSGRKNETVIAVWEALGENAPGFRPANRQHYSFRTNAPNYFSLTKGGALTGVFFYHFKNKPRNKTNEVDDRLVSKTLEYSGKSVQLSFQLRGDQFVLSEDGVEVGHVPLEAIVGLARAELAQREAVKAEGGALKAAGREKASNNQELLELEVTGTGAEGSRLFISQLNYTQSEGDKEDVRVSMIGFWYFKAR